MITLNNQAKEGGTYVIVITFKDENKNLLTPYNLTWWLSNEVGDPINNRENVSATVTAGILNIVLQGNDLTPGYKILTIKASYNSTYGTGLPLRDAVKFYVQDLVEEE